MKRIALVLAVLVVALCGCGERMTESETTATTAQRAPVTTTAPIQEPVILSVLEQVWNGFAEEQPKPQQIGMQGVDADSVVSYEYWFGAERATIVKISNKTVTVRFQTQGMAHLNPDRSVDPQSKGGDWVAEIAYGKAYEITLVMLDLSYTLTYTFTKNFS